MAAHGTVNIVMRKLNNLFYMQPSCGSSCKAIKCWKWDLTYLTMCPTRCQINYAVIILNRPISQSQVFIKDLWNNANVRMTVDGGTVQWDQFLTKLSKDAQKSVKNPDFITGDFDSITEDTLQKYKNKGCKVKHKIIHTPDQNMTDFTKALLELNVYSQQNNIEINHVFAVGQCSGRLDQILGNIQTLFLAQDKHLLSPNTKLYILSDDAISWLLSPGNHVICVPEETRKHKRAWCSLIPIGETCDSVTSSGLKWNLDNQPLKFGELVSTSNTFDGCANVKIKCSHTILWSMRIPSIAGQ